MALKFREDQDLSVLALASHEDLERLARVLTHDADDDKERLSQQLRGEPGFQRAEKQGDLRPAWKLIAAELQAYGGDSVANVVRSLAKGHTGVTYREILGDVCEHLKVGVKPDGGIKELEDQLLIDIIRKHFAKSSAEDLVRILQEIAKGAGLEECVKDGSSVDDVIRRIASDRCVAYLAALGAPAIAAASLPFLARLTVPAVLAAVAPRLGGVFVPGANVVAAASALTLLTSPALRVTLPAVLEVIRIRRRVLLDPLGMEAAA